MFFLPLLAVVVVLLLLLATAMGALVEEVPGVTAGTAKPDPVAIPGTFTLGSIDRTPDRFPAPDPVPAPAKATASAPGPGFDFESFRCAAPGAVEDNDLGLCGTTGLVGAGVSDPGVTRRSVVTMTFSIVLVESGARASASVVGEVQVDGGFNLNARQDRRMMKRDERSLLFEGGSRDLLLYRGRVEVEGVEDASGVEGGRWKGGREKEEAGGFGWERERGLRGSWKNLSYDEGSPCAPGISRRGRKLEAQHPAPSTCQIYPPRSSESSPLSTPPARLDRRDRHAGFHRRILAGERHADRCHGPSHMLTYYPNPALGTPFQHPL